jgi:aminoglycoside phosphotransferase (APT) family kinase protein
MAETYDQHLAALHHGWVTPLSLVADLLAGATGSSVVDIRRIVAGEQNEVYDVLTDHGSSLIVRIAHGGPEAHEREAWVLAQCAARGVAAPTIRAVRRIQVASERPSIMIMDKVRGERLSDAGLDESALRRVLRELGSWLADLHAIPDQGWGYLDGYGHGKLTTMADALDRLAAEAQIFEEAGRSVGLDVATVRAWLEEIAAAYAAVPPRIALIHNDLLANHVFVDDGHLSGIIDFGEVAAEPAASDFAKWEFFEGERFPVEWMQEGYGDPSLFGPPNDRTYRALLVENGLWRIRWYHETGYRAGAEAARDRLLAIGA